MDGRIYPPLNVSGSAVVHLGDNYFTEPSQAETALGRLIESLHFEGILQRYESIDSRTSTTYEWIFHPPSKEQQPWSSFLEWLHHGNLIYWVAGKPASGKSTLMKYLVDNVTAVKLDPNDKREPIILSYWFWEPGNTLQHNQLGCWRSVLWQLLHHPISKSIVSRTLMQVVPTTLSWSKTRLFSAVKAALSELHHAGFKVIMFLDGLDECGDDGSDLVLLLQSLTREFTHLKICVSSRPEQIFRDALSGNPKLLLQDLNYVDIKTHVSEQFAASPIVAGMLIGDHANLIEELKESLIDKAQGIFLWSVLVTRSILKGVTNRDSPDMLRKRLDELPGDLDGLYSHMLSRLGSDRRLYEREAALYFQITIHREMCIHDFCLAINNESRRRLLSSASTETAKVPVTSPDTVEQVATWVGVRTCGLLEAAHVSMCDKSRMLHANSGSNVPCKKVQFIHRTVRNFLLDTVEGITVISSCSLTNEAISSICLETMLARDVLDVVDDKRWRRLFPCICSPDLGCSLHLPTPALCDSIKQVCNQLLRASLLQTQKSWDPYYVDYIARLPAYHDGEIDFCRLFWYWRWYKYAQEAFDTSKAGKDTQYLSKLILTIITTLVENRESYWGPPLIEEDATNMRNFIDRLLLLGADLHTQVRLPHGETLSIYAFASFAASYVRPSLTLNTTGTGVGKGKYTVSAIPTIQAFDRFTNFHRRGLPQCFAPDEVLTVGTIWGEIVLSTIDNGQALKGYSVESLHRIYCICRVDRGVLKRMQPDKLYLISKADSDILLYYARSSKADFIKKPPRFNPFKMAVFEFLDTEPLLDAICGRSTCATTLMQALVHMGHHREIVQHYVELEEAEMRDLHGASEEWIRSWKVGVLGPMCEIKSSSVTAIQKICGRSKDLYLSEEKRVVWCSGADTDCSENTEDDHVTMGRMSRLSPLRLLQRQGKSKSIK